MLLNVTQAKAQQLASDRPAVCLIMNSRPGHHTGSRFAPPRSRSRGSFRVVHDHVLMIINVWTCRRDRDRNAWLQVLQDQDQSPNPYPLRDWSTPPSDRADRQSYQPKTVGPAFVGMIRIRQRRCLIIAVR